MTTEEQLIYTIHDIVRGAEFNQDDPLNERLMRQFISIHRGRLLNSYSRRGDELPDECFQSLPQIDFSLINGNYVSSSLPKIIQFRGYKGMMLNKDGYNVSVYNSEEYDNSIYDKFNKYQPKVKFINRKLTLYLGQEQVCNQIEDLTYSQMNTAIRTLVEESKSGSIYLNGSAILVNTDDETGYDWTSDPYPFPDELIENLINSVSAREFNLFLRVKSDETGDLRNNVAEHNTREEL